METTIPAKLLGLGTLFLALALFAVACGGNTLDFTVLTPTPQPTVVPTLAPEPTAAPIIVPTVEPTTAPVLAPTPEPATQVIPPTSEPATQVIPPTPEPPESTVPPEDRPVELRLMILKRDSDDNVTVLEKGGVLTSDDHYGIFFEPESDAWVYILQRDSTTAIDVLFPNPAFSDQTNPVSGGTPVWLPKDVNTWFRLDKNVGSESFFVVASREQDDNLEAIIARPDRVEVLGGLESLLKVEDRGVGGSETLDEEPRVFSDGSTVSLEQQLLRTDGDAFVYALPFEHE